MLMKNFTISRKALFAGAAAALLLASAHGASADVKLPAILGDHMVLQQEQPVPIWGTADKGEEVTVSFAGQKQSTKAGDDGKWVVHLQPLKASDQPGELTVQGKNKLDLKDILVGEVWVCSGQSNMEFSVNSTKNHEQEIKDATYPHIRLFTVPKSIKEEPQSDTKGDWAACTPETVGHFTAVGYFFGRDLHKALKVPVGLIHTSWGGTVAEAWAEHGHLSSDPEFKSILDNAEKANDKAGYEKKLEAWTKAAEKAKSEGKKAPNKPQAPGQNPNVASVLYNGMIAPIVPFAIKGATWYQGESNAGRAYQYRKLLPAMIKSWRDAWNQPGGAHDFPFLIVQLANFQAVQKEPAESDDWAELREAQMMTAEQPHNGIATAIDLADANNPGDIHPKDKQDVGHRLALVAEATVYGKPVEYMGPTYDTMKVEGNKAVIHFNHAEGLQAKNGEPLKGFQIAGEDKKWVWADAKIEPGSSGKEGSVVVSSDKVAKPVAVRYDWAHNPEGNLYNKADLPAFPFRTDDWPGKTAAAK